jgi:hypothetical protein
VWSHFWSSYRHSHESQLVVKCRHCLAPPNRASAVDYQRKQEIRFALRVVAQRHRSRQAYASTNQAPQL